MSLTQSIAINRFNCIDSQTYIRYTLWIELLQGKQYRGLLNIEVKITQLHTDLCLDWQGQPVKFLHINNKEAKIIQEQDQIKFVNQDLFEIGNNIIQIQFENEYSTDGHGLHSYIDSDDAQYLYSQCEPHHASKMIPCFDQPDLKGHFKLIAQAPKHWSVISNEIRSPQVVDLTVIQELGFLKPKDDYQVYEFKKSVPLSTYLFAILAGPYIEIKCPQQLEHNKIPMSLYCRLSLQKHVEIDATEIFTMTKNGLEYYEQLFQTPYPFSKYDQIFCPEYSTGAMENAGAVTINDSYVFKEDVPINQRSDRANTILHELSHMWFGDLVTMKWWDDLWLNESFAEFISHLCQTEANALPGVNHWVDFFKRKVWGYVEDQMETTHPIYCNIENTDQAENIFDGITYAKGAALLKQLYFMMGRDKFSKAMGEYFQTYKYKNSTLADFFNILKKAFEGEYLIQWQQDWIMKAGLNSISVAIQDGKALFTQNYTRPEHSTLRSQIFKVAVYDGEGNQIRVQQIQISAQQETVLDIGELKEDWNIFLNYNDESFLKTIYSQPQAAFFLKNLSKIEPSLSRILILRSIWDQVRDGQICFLVFNEGVLGHLLHETDDTVTQTVLQWCSGGIDFYTPRPYRDEIRDKLAKLVIEMISVTNNKNKLLILKDYLARWAKSKELLAKLLECFKTDEGQFGFIGLSNGWRILRNVFAYTDLTNEQKWELFDIWAKRDGTDEVRTQKRFLESLNSKENLWAYLTDYKKEESVQSVEQVMAAFNHEIHHEKLVEYENKYFDMLPHIFDTQSTEYGTAFYHGLYPINDNIPLYIEKCQQLLKQTNKDVLIKLLRESIDQDARRSKTYLIYQQYKQ